MKKYMNREWVLTRTIVSACLLTLTLGCGDDGNEVQLPAVPAGADAETSSDTGMEDTSMPDPDEGPMMDEGMPPQDDGMPPAGPNVLLFSDTSCGSPCAITVAEGVSATLSVTYQNDKGEPIEGALVSFSTNDTELLLGAKTSYTLANGVAETTVSATAGSKGVFEVSATVSGDDEAGSLRFTVTATADAPPPLQVTVNYTGSGDSSQVELRLFLQEGGSPICSDVHPDVAGAKPTAVLSKPGVGVTQTVTFSQLPGLDDTTPNQVWMVQALAGDVLSPVAAGCTQGIAVSVEGTAQATVTVADLPLKFAGDYDVKTDVDMYTGIGGDGGSVLGWIIGIFESPGATAIKAACADPSGFLSTVCSFMVDGSGNPAGIGISVAELGDEAFFALMAENLGESFVFNGASIAALLKEMKLGSTLTFASEPSVPTATGADFVPGSITEKWETASFYWKFGLNCDPQDENYEFCGLQTVKLSDIYGVTLQANPNGGVDSDNTVNIAQHQVVGFNYGTLLNFIIEKKVLPYIFTDPEGWLPPIDTYGKLVATLFGDKYCLYYDDCCEWFAGKVEDQIADYIAIPACEAAIPAADFFIRDLITDLGGPLTIGTKADGACPAFDLQGDRDVDTLGSVNAKCEWDATFDISGQAFSPDNTWFGKHK